MINLILEDLKKPVRCPMPIFSSSGLFGHFQLFFPLEMSSYFLLIKLYRLSFHDKITGYTFFSRRLNSNQQTHAQFFKVLLLLSIILLILNDLFKFLSTILVK
jgi:hypothetical protein